MKDYKCSHENGEERVVLHVDEESAAEEFVEWMCSQDPDYYGVAERHGIKVTVDGSTYEVHGEHAMTFSAEAAPDV